MKVLLFYLQGGESMPAQDVKFLKAPNHLEKELGSLTSFQSEKIKEILSVFISKLRIIQRRWTGVFYGQYPEMRRPCHTCAFNPTEDNREGFAATAYGLMRTLRRDSRFYCHYNQPLERQNLYNPETLEPCMGWMVVMVDDEAKAYADTAFSAISEIVPIKVEENRGT